jgi:hypothetical protein
MLGTLVIVRIYNSNMAENYNMAFDNNLNMQEQNVEILSIETSNIEEKTTPNTLITYKIYYTKCKHYIQEYKEIDVSFVNLTEKEFAEKNRGWDIDKFSSEEIEMSKEEEAFCNQHYKLKLENESIVIYNIDENGKENEYEHTGITTEYLTEQDILKLKTGIYVFGKENLTSTMEDFE